MKNRNEVSRRKSDVSTVGEAIDSMLKAYKIRGRFDENRLIGMWGTMMGAPIAKRTEKLFINKKVLHVKLNSAPLRQELTIAKSKVLEILHRNFDASLVEDVRFY